MNEASAELLQNFQNATPVDDDSALREFGMRAIELAPGVSTEESMQGAAELLSERAAKAVRNLD